MLKILLFWKGVKGVQGTKFAKIPQIRGLAWMLSKFPSKPEILGF